MVKKRKGKAKKSGIKRKPIAKKSKPKKKRAGDVDVLKSDVADEALERAGDTSRVTYQCNLNIPTLPLGCA
jgi:hypothetical protein